jgi:hypothetical protein
MGNAIYRPFQAAKNIEGDLLAGKYNDSRCYAIQGHTGSCSTVVEDRSFSSCAIAYKSHRYETFEDQFYSLFCNRYRHKFKAGIIDVSGLREKAQSFR